MVQQVLVFIIFLAAIAYVGRLVYRSFIRNECATGCGKCSAIDFNKLEKKLKERGV